MARQPTCGAGLAHNAAVPAKLADVAGTLARNLDAHIPALDLDDPDAAREHDVYERLGDRLRRAAAELEVAGAEMAAARDLPMGRHDMAAITTPEVLEAFEDYVAAEGELHALLGVRLADDRAMLAAIREAVSGAGAG